jgi:DNA-binding CsgD family transcriptional regulator
LVPLYNQAIKARGDAKTTGSRWRQINDCILSFSAERTIDGFGEKILEGISSLIGFGGSGCIIDARDERPRIVKHVNSERKWMEHFNHYYNRIAASPAKEERAFSAGLEELRQINRREYINDFLLPQKISSSAGLMLCDERGGFDFCFVFNRLESERAFDEEELQALGVIQLHVKQRYSMLRMVEELRRLPVMRMELGEGARLLSERECEVANLLFRRMKPVQIASELRISPLTVKKHIANIYAKLNVKDRRQLFERMRPEIG